MRVQVDEGLFDLGQDRQEAVRKMKTFFTTAGLVGGVVLGTGAGLLIWGGTKWKSPWNIVGYAGGALCGLGALNLLLGGLMLRGIFGMAEEGLEEGPIVRPGGTVLPEEWPADIEYDEVPWDAPPSLTEGRR